MHNLSSNTFPKSLENNVKCIMSIIYVIDHDTSHYYDIEGIKSVKYFHK